MVQVVSGVRKSGSWSVLLAVLLLQLVQHTCWAEAGGGQSGCIGLLHAEGTPSSVLCCIGCTIVFVLGVCLHHCLVLRGNSACVVM